MSKKSIQAKFRNKIYFIINILVKFIFLPNIHKIQDQDVCIYHKKDLSDI